jgi:hypothetical protein
VEPGAEWRTGTGWRTVRPGSGWDEMLGGAAGLGWDEVLGGGWVGALARPSRLTSKSNGAGGSDVVNEAGKSLRRVGFAARAWA